MVALSLISVVISLFFTIYRYMYIKQTLTGEIMESVSDVVISVNYIKSDLSSAVLDPSAIDTEKNGKQTSKKKIDEILSTTISKSKNKFSFLVSDGEKINRIEYEIDGANFMRTVKNDRDENVARAVLSRDKISGASIEYEIVRFDNSVLLCIKLFLNLKTRELGKNGFETVTRNMAFNIFPYVMNLNLKNIKFASN